MVYLPPIKCNVVVVIFGNPYFFGLRGPKSWVVRDEKDKNQQGFCEKRSPKVKPVSKDSLEPAAQNTLKIDKIKPKTDREL